MMTALRPAGASATHNAHPEQPLPAGPLLCSGNPRAEMKPGVEPFVWGGGAVCKCLPRGCPHGWVVFPNEDSEASCKNQALHSV